MTNKDYSEYCNLLHNTVIPSTITQEEMDIILKPLNDWVDKHTPAQLYKFRECNENNINAFRNQQIWFATGATMNDDYDAILYCDKNEILAELNSLFDMNGTLIFLKALKDGDDIPKRLYDLFGATYIENARDIVKNADNTAINEMSLSIKTFMENGFKAQFPFISHTPQNVVKFSSFSENICSPLMWGHYANNSSGFALAYDFREKHYNECHNCSKLGVTCITPKFNRLLPIFYADKMFEATDYARYLMQDAFTRKFLFDLRVPEPLWQKVLASITCSDIFMQTKTVFHKFNKWDYEKEWRMTVSYNSTNYPYDQTANIWKKPCALYLGRKIKDTDELILRNIAFKQKIPVFKMVIDDKSKDYRLKPIRQKNITKQLLLK